MVDTGSPSEFGADPHEWATYIDCYLKNGVTTVFDHHASYGGIKDSLFAIEDVAKSPLVSVRVFVTKCLIGDGWKNEGRGLRNEAFIKHAPVDDSDRLPECLAFTPSFISFRCYFGLLCSA